MPNLLNKKTIIGIVIILLLAGVYFIFFYEKESEVYQRISKADVSKASLIYSQNPEKDSDNDGLKDWEEALWKTDPNNPDTDGDGTKDGEEIDQNRDPLKQGPNDALSPVAIEDRKPETLSNLINQQIFAEIMIGKENDDLNPTNLAGSIMETLENYSGVVNEYNLSDLNISSKKGSEAIKEYGNNFGEVIERYFSHIPEGEITVLSKFTSAQNQTESEIKELAELAEAYKKVSEEALKMEVSADLAEIHLAVINSFSQISGQLNKMKKGFTDPMLVLIGLKQYQTSSINAYNALKQINDYLSKSNVVFDDKDPGKILTLYL